MTLPLLHGRNSRDVKERNIYGRDRVHEMLHDELLEVRRPRNRDQKENDRKREVTEPRPAAREEDTSGRYDNGRERERPAEQTPVRICFGKKTDGQQDQRTKK